MLLRNADIKAAIGKAPGKLGKAGTVHHRSRDRDNAWVCLRQPHQCFPKDVGVGRHGLLFLAEPIFDKEWRNTMEMGRLSFGQLISLALDGRDLQDDRLLDILDHVDRFDELADVMPVHDPEVPEPELLEEDRRQVQSLQQGPQPAKSASHQWLSLIHISEPTRPY